MSILIFLTSFWSKFQIGNWFIGKQIKVYVCLDYICRVRDYRRKWEKFEGARLCLNLCLHFEFCSSHCNTLNKFRAFISTVLNDLFFLHCPLSSFQRGEKGPQDTQPYFLFVVSNCKTIAERILNHWR